MEMLELDERGEIVGLLTISDPKGDTQRWYRKNKRVVEHEHVSPARYYVNGHDDVVPRPAMGPFLATIPGGFRLTGLPQPCKVGVNGQTWDVPDGTFEYATPLSGTHEVAVSAWPHLDWRTSVELEAKTETEESRTSTAANVRTKLGRLWRWMRGASRI